MNLFSVRGGFVTTASRSVVKLNRQAGGSAAYRPIAWRAIRNSPDSRRLSGAPTRRSCRGDSCQTDRTRCASFQRSNRDHVHRSQAFDKLWHGPLPAAPTPRSRADSAGGGHCDNGSTPEPGDRRRTALFAGESTRHRNKTWRHQSTRPADFGFHVLPRLVGRAAVYEISEYLIDIGTMETYATVQSTWPGL